MDDWNKVHWLLKVIQQYHLRSLQICGETAAKKQLFFYVLPFIVWMNEWMNGLIQLGMNEWMTETKFIGSWRSAYNTWHNSSQIYGINRGSSHQKIIYGWGGRELLNRLGWPLDYFCRLDFIRRRKK